MKQSFHECGVKAVVRPADYRAALCRFEDALFAVHREGHAILSLQGALALIDRVFRQHGREVPALELVPGFADPRVGGFADIAGHRILIEKGCLYRFLILHEAAHILMPHDLYHGPAFLGVLWQLYRDFIGISESHLTDLARKRGLPSSIGRLEPALVAAA